MIVKSRGLTIIELMFVVVIVAAVIMVGVKRFQTLKQTRDIEHLAQAVQLLKQATTDYYYQVCASADSCEVDLGKLEQYGLLPNRALLTTPFSNQMFVVNAEPIADKSYRLSVAIDLDRLSAEQAVWYAERLQADKVDDAVGLQWLWLPSTHLAESGTNFAVSNVALAVFTKSINGR